MADVKISALPAATTPLAGTEVLPIVQSGATDQVSVANLTAGRVIAAAGLTVDANSASTAVRITQTGAGSCFLVEDDTSPDSTPFVITATGAVGIGTLSPATPLHVDGGVVTIGRYGSGAGIVSRTANGTLAAPTALTNGATAGQFIGRGYDGAAYQDIAAVQIKPDATVTPTNSSGYLVINTTPASATTALERVRVTSAGNVLIGNINGTNKLDITGSFGRGAPITKTGDFTLADTENWVICNGTGSITVTFPAASSWTGREVMIKTIAAQTVVSASSNVVPIDSATAGTAILAGTAGKWATLVSNGTNWVIMAAN